MDEADRSHRCDLGARSAAHHESLLGQALSSGLFRFVQFELAWPLGPPEGRHVLRGSPPPGSPEAKTPITQIVVLGRDPRGRSDPGPAPRGRRRSPAAERASITGAGSATVIETEEPFTEEPQARSWLKHAGEPELTRALAALDRVLHAHRLATADPWVLPVPREHLSAARAGYGTGEELAAGRWSDARELAVDGDAEHRARRRRRLGAGEARLAALLSGSERALACEELALRVRLDLIRGRHREAALQLLIALDAAIAELSPPPDAAAAERISALRERRGDTAAAAQAALTGVPEPAAQEAVAQTLGMLEATLRARRGA